MPAERRLSLWYASHRYSVLFYSLLLSLSLPPILEQAGITDGGVEFLLGANVLAAVWALDRGWVRATTLAILLIALIARPAGVWLSQEALSTMSLAIWSIVALVAAAAGLRFALRGQTVGSQQVYAALSTYLLAGLFFGVIYSVLEYFVPGSLAGGGSAGPPGLPVASSIYFSFVTLASLGYGDILPVSDAARGLAVVEVIGGQLFLAVMVARLVSAWR